MKTFRISIKNELFRVREFSHNPPSIFDCCNFNVRAFISGKHAEISFSNENSISINFFQENRYTYNQTSTPTSAAPVKFRAEETLSQNKYVTHYPTTTTHLQYYAQTNQQEVPKSSYAQSTSIAPSLTTTSELSQDITSLLMKEQGSDSTKRVLQTSSVADYLSHLPTSLSLHHFLKYSADAAIKKEAVVSWSSKQVLKQGKEKQIFT